MEKENKSSLAARRYTTAESLRVGCYIIPMSLPSMILAGRGMHLFSCTGQLSKVSSAVHHAATTTHAAFRL